MNAIYKYSLLFIVILLSSCTTTSRNVNLEFRNENQIFGDIRMIKARTINLTYISCEDLCQETMNKLLEQSEEFGGDTIYNLRYQQRCGEALFNVCEISAVVANSWETYNYFPSGGGGRHYDE